MMPDIRAKKIKHALRKHLFIIDERFQRYLHLPHQVANNGINCYDTKLSTLKKFFSWSTSMLMEMSL